MTPTQHDAMRLAAETLEPLANLEHWTVNGRSGLMVFVSGYTDPHERYAAALAALKSAMAEGEPKDKNIGPGICDGCGQKRDVLYDASGCGPKHASFGLCICLECIKSAEGEQTLQVAASDDAAKLLAEAEKYINCLPLADNAAGIKETQEYIRKLVAAVRSRDAEIERLKVEYDQMEQSYHDVVDGLNRAAAERDAAVERAGKLEDLCDDAILCMPNDWIAAFVAALAAEKTTKRDAAVDALAKGGE